MREHWSRGVKTWEQVWWRGPRVEGTVARKKWRRNWHREGGKWELRVNEPGIGGPTVYPLYWLSLTFILF